MRSSSLDRFSSGHPLSARTLQCERLSGRPAPISMPATAFQQEIPERLRIGWPPVVSGTSPGAFQPRLLAATQTVITLDWSFVPTGELSAPVVLL